MATLTVGDLTPRDQYTATSGQTVFTYSFPIFSDSDLKVYVGSTLKTLSSDYTVTAAGTSSGGTVVFGSVVTTGAVVTIYRDLPVARTTDYATGGALLAENLNDDLDKLVMMVQQQEDQLKNNTLTVDQFDEYGNLTLPSKTARVGRVLGFNATTGDPEAGPSIANVSSLASITSAIETVAGIDTNVTTVSGIAANVTSVAGVASNVTTVAGNNANVSAVGSSISSVNTVAGIASNVTTVAGISANTTTVAGISSDVTAVAGNNANVTTVAGNNANVTTVAGIASDVTAVAGISGDIADVQNKLAEVQTVADDLQESVSEIETVAGAVANVNTVGGAIANVNTVAGISANVTTVAGISANTTTVAGISADVTSVAGDITNIGTVASNLSSVNAFSEQYRIAATAPTTSLDEGDLWFDTTSGVMKVYDGSGFINAGSSVNGIDNSVEHLVTTATDTFAATYDAGYLNVFLNGVKLDASDYTATDGSNVVLDTDAAVGDTVFIQSFGTFALADHYTKTEADAAIAAGGVAGIVSTADDTAITIDSSENVGIGVTPDSWSGSMKSIDISSATSITGANFGGVYQSYLTHNGYYEGPWKYKNTGFASSMYIQDGTTKFQVAPSGTADTAISWSDALTITNTGTTSIKCYKGTDASPTESRDWPTPVLALRAYGDYQQESMLSFGYPNDAIYQTGDNVWNFRLEDGTTPISSSSGTNLNLRGPGDLSLGADGRFTVKADGAVSIGSFNASGTTAGFITTTGSEPNLKSSTTITGLSDHYSFYSPNGRVGYIRTSGSSTEYSTTSDYRLKENVVPMTGSIDRLKELKPSRFNFIADADLTVDGFLAHEAGEVVPEAISGDKDAMKTEEYEVTPAVEAVIDEDGSITTEAIEAVMGEREVEDYQGIDQSKLVPLLVASLQEAVARIEELTTRIETLEVN